MPREAEPANIQRSFVENALAKGLRLDGRGRLQARPVKVSFAMELGQLTVSMGDTRVMAHVTATVQKPFPDRPYEGFLNISTEISPMASPYFEAGRASEEEAQITRLLDKSLRKSNCLDREALCIVAGQKVWSIDLTLHFQADDGNLVDCACLAGITALRHYRKPEVSVIGDEVTLYSVDERVPVPLALHFVPICVTLAFLTENNLVVVDPTHLESRLANSTMTLTMTQHKEICVLAKSGGAPLSPKELMECLNLGACRASELADQFEKALQEDLSGKQLDLR